MEEPFPLRLPAEHPLQLTPGITLDFGVARPLGNGLVLGVVGHAILWQLNVAFGPLSSLSKVRFNKKNIFDGDSPISLI